MKSYALRAWLRLADYPFTVAGVALGLVLAVFLVTRTAAIDHRVDKIEERVIILDRGVTAAERTRRAERARVCRTKDPKSAACADLRRVIRSLTPEQTKRLKATGRVTTPRPKTRDRTDHESGQPTPASPPNEAPATAPEPPAEPAPHHAGDPPVAPPHRPATPDDVPKAPAPSPPPTLPTPPLAPVLPVPSVDVTAPGVEVHVGAEGVQAGIDPAAVIGGLTGASSAP